MIIMHVYYLCTFAAKVHIPLMIIPLMIIIIIIHFVFVWWCIFLSIFGAFVVGCIFFPNKNLLEDLLIFQIF
jgi:hypothetical protein